MLHVLAVTTLWRTSNAAMAMGGGGSGVAPWFTALPLSDPRCRNDSCKAFKAGHTASQLQISWTSQFLYGQYVTWYYLAFIGLFAAIFGAHTAQDRWLREVNDCATKPGLIDKLTAAVRSISYRRISGRVGVYFGLPSVGIMVLMQLATVATAAMSFAQHP